MNKSAREFCPVRDKCCQSGSSHESWNLKKMTGFEELIDFEIVTQRVPYEQNVTNKTLHFVPVSLNFFFLLRKVN